MVGFLSARNSFARLTMDQGTPFVEKYLRELQREGRKDTPDTSTLSQSSEEEAHIWLQTCLKEITNRLGLSWKQEGDATAAKSYRDMMEFVGFTEQAVYRGMEKELATVEKETLSMQDSSLGDHRQDSLTRRPCDLFTNSHQSDTLGKAVSALLKHHPSKLSHICQQLQGRPLPSSLRPIVWSMRLQVKKNAGGNIHVSKDLDSKDLVDTLYSEFVHFLEFGSKELGVSNVLYSPIAGIIRHTVTQAHLYRPGLQTELVSDWHLKKAEEALNVLYVFKRSYEPQFALLVFPLIFAFHGNNGMNSLCTPAESFTDFPHKLAFSLNLLLRNCFPTRLQVFSMADHVIQRIHKEDKELYNHLIHETKKNVSLDPHEFLVNFIHTEKEKAMLADKQTEGSSFESLPLDATELLFHPTMFVRKWLAEGLVGTLGINAVTLIWDQCFMSHWSPTVMENACLVVLQLLRSNILSAVGYSGIRRVLLDLPFELFTLDIQQGLSYLNNGGALLDVGSLRQPTQLPSLSEHGDVIPSPTRSPIQSHHSTVTRPDSGRSTESTLQQTDPEELWVEMNRNSAVNIEVTTNHDPFDVYVDEVRFIPDNATAIKVTGRILDPFWKKPPTLDIPDIEAYPLLDSSARCPKFHSRFYVGLPATGITGEAMLLLRIYTLDVNTGELIVVGNSIVRLFNENGNEWTLNAGGHQLRLKHILPSTVAKLSEEAFHGITNVPVCSILIRLLPSSEEYIEPPGYSSGCYNSDQCQPNDSEWRIFRRFKNHRIYPPTVREAVQDVKEGEASHEDGFDFTNDQAVYQWYQQRTSKHLLMRQPATAIDLVKVVQYDQKQGLSVMVEQAFGLPGNVPFVNVLVYVSPGSDIHQQQNTQDGFGGEEKALVQKRDFNSYQRAPKWIDPPIIFKPPISQTSALVIRLCSLDAAYTPNADRAAPGIVTASKGNSLTVTPFSWSVMPLFSKEYVNAGLHYLPLFEGSPSPSFLEFLSNHAVDVSMKEAVRQNIHSLQGVSCVAVRLWDAHYSIEDCIPLPVHEELLSIVGKQEKYKKLTQTGSGKLISDVVLQTLTRTERKEGVTGNSFRTEKEHYEQAMNNVFNSLLDDILLESGMGPMV
ncbi:PREDICTED: uncharacterized protein LOC107347559 isoform X2 [Acropora digitifera]|uniref:uncharacterized protein LOC107347559 isoform X2 n=1 Tax=Acropora digitifera TaxID=70779 RepID=UPI00077A613C|nr:PREDICTED: uncharacterized protein LOC107347559 isoform X2 [Acropora digitifera]